MTVSRNSYCTCLFYSATALARRISRIAEEEFEATGLAPSQGFIVMTVNRKPGITAGDIARIMQIQPSTLTRLVDKLEDHGYLSRHTEGKFMRVYPTTRATQLHESLQAAWGRLYKRYANILGEQQSRRLTSAIYKASNKLEAD